MIDSRKGMGKWQALILFILYLRFFAVYTIGTRAVGPRRWNLVPFWEIRFALAGGINTFHYLIINILLCIPMGYLASCLLEKLKKWKILLVVTAYSIMIELIQLITGRGLCEFDDVFNNTLGGLIGMVCYFGPLQVFDACAVTIVYGASMFVLELTQNGNVAFWRVPEVLIHTFILYIPAHAILSVFIFEKFGMYRDMFGKTGRSAVGMILLANLLSVLSKFLIQYFLAYSFSVTGLYYITGFILQSFLTLYARRGCIKQTR